jgi:hypothetical protein
MGSTTEGNRMKRDQVKVIGIGRRAHEKRSQRAKDHGLDFGQRQHALRHLIPEFLRNQPDSVSYVVTGLRPAR